MQSHNSTLVKCTPMPTVWHKIMGKQANGFVNPQNKETHKLKWVWAIATTKV